MPNTVRQEDGGLVFEGGVRSRVPPAAGQGGGNGTVNIRWADDSGIEAETSPGVWTLAIPFEAWDA